MNRIAPPLFPGSPEERLQVRVDAIAGGGRLYKFALPAIFLYTLC